MGSANSLKKVCLCGRPNVGKSSLFNRLIGRKKALVLDTPGVTRDVHRTRASWNGHTVELADLAGLELWADREAAAHAKRDHGASELKKLAIQAALEYLKGSDLVLFIVDGRTELTPADEELARVVRATGREALIVLSKIEGQAEGQAQVEAARLGWGAAVATSAEHNIGIEELKETLLERLYGKTRPAEPSEAETETEAETGARGLSRQRPIRLGVYGRPNVGKSTLVNRLIGEKRMITSPIAGTTVDTVDTDFMREGKYYRILDTAGIRKKSKTEKGVEVLSVVQALRSVQHVDASLFLIDGYEGVTDQDEKVAGELCKAGRPIVIVVNKWDLCRIEKDKYAERLRKVLAFLDFAPVLFISAESGEGLEPLWDLLDEMIEQRMNVAPTGELNRFLEMVEGTNNPTNVKLFYASQSSKNPPTITILVDEPTKVHFAYERYLKNELRQRYGWMGSPLKLIFRARKRSPSKKARRSTKSR